MLDRPRYVTDPAPIYTPSAGSCKAPGCTCKDARILSTRKAEFVRFLAEQRGQTVDRVVPASPLSTVLLRPSESEVAKSEEHARFEATWPEPRPRAADACACYQCADAGGCENRTTIDRPVRCRECAFGNHRQAAA